MEVVSNRCEILLYTAARWGFETSSNLIERCERLKRFPAGRSADVEKYSLIYQVNRFIITDKRLGGEI